MRKFNNSLQFCTRKEKSLEEGEESLANNRSWTSLYKRNKGQEMQAGIHSRLDRA